MKSFLVNGQKIKPTITDDWKYYFQEDGGMVLTSEKLDLKIPLRAAKIEKFFDQVHKSTITIVGNSIVGDYLINKDLILISLEDFERTNSSTWEQGVIYKNKKGEFVYLGEFYSQKASPIDSAITKPKKIKIGVDLEDKSLFEVQEEIFPEIVGKCEDYGKYLSNIDKKAITMGMLYLGRGLPSGKFDTFNIDEIIDPDIVSEQINKSVAVLSGYDAVKTEFNGSTHIICRKIVRNNRWPQFPMQFLSFIDSKDVNSQLKVDTPLKIPITFIKDCKYIYSCGIHIRFYESEGFCIPEDTISIYSVNGGSQIEKSFLVDVLKTCVGRDVEKLILN